MKIYHLAKILKVLVGIALSTYLFLLVIFNLQPIKNVWINEIEKGISNAINSKVVVNDIEVDAVYVDSEIPLNKI